MDAYALKSFVDVRTKQSRMDAPPLGAPPGREPVTGTANMPEQMPDAGRARQEWTIYVPPYKELSGLMSTRALEQHMLLYQGYLDRAKSAEGLPPAERRKLYETDDVAGACLHELFFEGLSALPPPPAISSQNAFILRYGDLDSWWREMANAGAVAKGWSVTAVCSTNPSDLTVFSLESHDHGLPPGYIPLCVADVYEHAYFMDHGTDKMRYLEVMQKFLNWEAIDSRFLHATR